MRRNFNPKLIITKSDSTHNCTYPIPLLKNQRELDEEFVTQEPEYIHALDLDDHVYSNIINNKGVLIDGVIPYDKCFRLIEGEYHANEQTQITAENGKLYCSIGDDFYRIYRNGTIVAEVVSLNGYVNSKYSDCTFSHIQKIIAKVKISGTVQGGAHQKIQINPSYELANLPSNEGALRVIQRLFEEEAEVTNGNGDIIYFGQYTFTNERFIYDGDTIDDILTYTFYVQDLSYNIIKRTIYPHGDSYKLVKTFDLFDRHQNNIDYQAADDFAYWYGDNQFVDDYVSPNEPLEISISQEQTTSYFLLYKESVPCIIPKQYASPILTTVGFNSNGFSREYLLPIHFHSPQFKQDESRYEKTDGVSVLLYAKSREEYEAETDYIPLWFHRKIQQLFMLETITTEIDGETVGIIKSDTYSIDWENYIETDCGEKLVRATFKVQVQSLNKNTNGI